MIFPKYSISLKSVEWLLHHYLPMNFFSYSLILFLCNLNNSTDVADNFQVRPMYKTKSLLHPSLKAYNPRSHKLTQDGMLARCRELIK